MRRERVRVAKRRQGLQQMLLGTGDDGCQRWYQPKNVLCKRGMIARNNGIKYIDSGIDIAGAVQRIEADNVHSIQMRGWENELFFLLAVDRSNLIAASLDVKISSNSERAHLAAVLEKMNQSSVRQKI